MHAQRELNRLALRKNLLRHRIRMRRVECAGQISVVVRPLDWLDGARAKWARISPMAKVAALPLGLLVKRVFFPRARVLGALIRWAPMVMALFRPVR